MWYRERNRAITSMKYLLLSILLASCGATHCGTPQIKDNSYFKMSSMTVDGINDRGRVFYIPYINGKATQLNDGNFGDLKRGMISKGYQVISFDMFQTQADTFKKDGGREYSEAYDEFIRNLAAYSSYKYGPAKETIVGGVSFGGLHTLRAIIDNGDLFDRYFTLVSVIDPNKLAQFPGNTVTVFTAIGHYEALKAKPSLQVWGSNDEITDFRLQKAMCPSLGTAECHEVQGTGHGVEKEHVDFVLNWLR